MKKVLFILFFTISLTSFSQSQHEMSKEAREAYEKADVELNTVYKKIVTKYKSDTLFINKLRKTQRIWITYRDAELEMKFPAENKELEYGSVYSMCTSLFLTTLTEERSEKLSIWLNGVEEGDVCSGSIKIN